MRTGIAVIAFVLFLAFCGNVRAAGGRDSMSSLILAQGSMGGEVISFDLLEYVAFETPANRGWEYEISSFSFIPLVFMQEPGTEGVENYVGTYNFRGLINSLFCVLAAPESKGGFYDTAEVMESPWRYALFAPNCRFRVRLAGGLKLLLATRTDYMLYRSGGTERGIIFTPQIGLDLSGGRFGGQAGYGGISVSLGYRNWWKFDSENRSEGLTILVRLWGIPDTP